MSARTESKQSRKNKKKARLSLPLDRRLKDYSLAAAGVGALALASPAHAAIASNTLNITIPADGNIHPISVPGHPTGPLSIGNFFYSDGEGSGQGFSSAGVGLFDVGGSLFGNPFQLTALIKKEFSGLAGQHPGRNPNHLRVKKGRFISKVARGKNLHRTGKIGPKKPGAHIATSSISSVSATPGLFLSPVSAGVQVPGALAHESNFIGLVYSSFDGKVYKPFLGTGKFAGFSIGTGPTAHYGWVQLNITQNANHSFSVTVVNDAIEQCAGQPIQVGLTSGGANCTTPPPTTPAPNSLLLMSLGVAGLAGLETLRRLRKTA